VSLFFTCTQSINKEKNGSQSLTPNTGAVGELMEV
jgi:hypothetical protein